MRMLLITMVLVATSGLHQVGSSPAQLEDYLSSTTVDRCISSAIHDSS